MSKYLLIIVVFIATAFSNCRSRSEHAGHDMEVADIYTCPMDPQVIRNKPGSCPICGMDLVKKETGGESLEDIGLETLVQPANEFVLSTIPVTTVQKREEQLNIEALGTITYDTRQAGIISSRIAGRIEKLYVRFRYQKITKGEHLLDIYSPELVTAQQNLLFLLKNDPENTSFIQSAKERLMLLGMTNSQVQQIMRSGKPMLSIAVYSNYSGHIHEAENEKNMQPLQGTAMKDISLQTEELSLKEGMYVQKGQSIFTVYDPGKAWAVLNIYADKQDIVKRGNTVRIFPETSPDNDFTGTIDFIEPYYREQQKTLTARVYFNNAKMRIPIGSQVTATIFGNAKEAWWLPKEAVLSLGLDNVVFLKTNGGFKVGKVSVGVTHDNHVQVISGIGEKDSVALNAQYLMDSESFIKVKN